VSENDRRFQDAVLPHLDAAFNLARWLTGNDHDARDVVQDACLRAYRSIGQLRGASARPWLLAIVRNACFSWLRANRPSEVAGSLDDTERAGITTREDPSPGPEALALENLDRKVLNDAIAALPAPYREVLILRELEELSYHDIANVIGAPIGTVMSRLSRGRRLLAQSFHVVLSHVESGGRR